MRPEFSSYTARMQRTLHLESLAAVALFTIASSPLARAEGVLEQRAQQVARMVAKEPVIDAALFDKDFLKAVPAPKLKSILADLHEKFGGASSMTLRSQDSEFFGRYELTLERDFVIPVKLGLQPKAPHAIETLWFGPPVPALKDFEAVIAELAKLPGKTGLSCREVDGGEGRAIAEKDAKEPFAVGSAFKLYVLGALALDVENGQHKLEDVVRLEEASRSRPSGRMHLWPLGSPVTLSTLALAMISESDNTASDTLIAAVTRGACEAALATMGNSVVASNKPFLTTHELFKLKFTSRGQLADTFAGLDERGRRAFLDKEVRAQRLEERDFDIGLMAKPSHIATIEWFASPRDMNRAMEALLRATEPTKRAAPLRAVLAVNPGIPALRDEYEWIGFKGGSEPGVMNLTFLLKAKDGRFFVLSASWNDPAAAVDEGRFVGIVGRAGHLLAKHAARTPDSK